MVRYSNGIEMNGHGRKSKSPDIAMAPIRNGNGVHQVIILIVMEMIIFEVKRWLFEELDDDDDDGDYDDYDDDIDADDDITEQRTQQQHHPLED